jgi:hypothetical protein
VQGGAMSINVPILRPDLLKKHKSVPLLCQFYKLLNFKINLFFSPFQARNWRHFSENIAPLHHFINLIFSFNKLSVVQGVVQVWCKWVQGGCKVKHLKTHCTTVKILIYFRKGRSGAMVQSKKCSAPILQPSFPLVSSKKNRLSIID